MVENWLNIDGYGGYYQVSDLGRVRSIKKNGVVKILKPEIHKFGYYIVTLTKQYKRKKYLIHRLVCITFNGKSDCIEKNQVDHINTVRTDNRPSNLRWVSNKENCNNSITKKHMSEGKKGVVCYWKGKSFSDEHKRKISESNKGKKMSDDAKKKISEGNRGKVRSEEVKRRISESMSGRPSPRKGVHLSEETKKKLSEAHKK